MSVLATTCQFGSCRRYSFQVPHDFRNGENRRRHVVAKGALRFIAFGEPT